VTLTRQVGDKQQEVTRSHRIVVDAAWTPRRRRWGGPGTLSAWSARDNLLSNAVTYSPAGGIVEGRVGVTESEEGAGVAVHDHGIGLPDADLPDIFARFPHAPTLPRPRLPHAPTPPLPRASPAVGAGF